MTTRQFKAQGGPAQEMLASYFKTFDKFAQASQPYTKSALRAQMEVGGLMMRRARANFELPSRLAQCRTPADLFFETVNFWVGMIEDTTVTANRAVQALGLPNPVLDAQIDDWVPSDHGAAVDAFGRVSESNVFRQIRRRRKASDDEPLVSAA